MDPLSAAEADTGGLFINGYQIVPIQTALIELDHLQPKTTLKADNSTSKGYTSAPSGKSDPNHGIHVFTG